MVENDLPIGAPLINILATEDQTSTGKDLCLDRVQFVFATQTITLEAIAETDEIKLLQSPTTEISEATPPDWGRSLLGKKLQTLWMCENAQGYLDQVILAFEYLHPSLSFIAEGSVLKAFQSQPVQKKTHSASGINAVSEAAIAGEIPHH